MPRVESQYNNLLHRRWLGEDTVLSFHSAGRRVAYLDASIGQFKIRLASAHLPHSERPDDEYDEALMVLGEIVERGRRGGVINIV
eukprot:5271121-Pyramimonas_sp.AAC.1